MIELTVHNEDRGNEVQLLKKAGFDLSIGIIGKQSKEVDGILYQQLTRDEMIDILIQERFGYTDKGVAS